MKNERVPIDFRDGRLEPSLVPEQAHLRVESHRPQRFVEPYHHHASVEINFLDGVEMTYAFADRKVRVPQRTLTIFWGGAPHRVVDVSGGGKTTNLYLSLGAFLRCAPTAKFVDALFGGAVLAAKVASERDGIWLKQVFEESLTRDPAWQSQHLLETKTRLARLFLEGWSSLLPARQTSQNANRTRADMSKVEAMMRFVSDNYASPICNADIANAAGISSDHAARLFSQILGQSMKSYVSTVRVGHAQMLLRESDLKISAISLDSGFRTLSSFYEAFKKTCNESPAEFRRRRI